MEKKHDFIRGSIKHLGMLYDLAVCKTESQGIPFKSEEYKWVLGAKVIHELETNYDIYQVTTDPDTPRSLFGIVVEADIYNPNNIQLWENITNKL